LTPSPPNPASAPTAAQPGESGFARLEVFYQQHSQAVYRAAHRITGNAADAEDVLQTVFLRLARRDLAELDDAVGGYLHRAAVNAALDVVRSRQRAGWVPLDPVASSALEPADGGPDPERLEGSRQLRAHLRLALSRLTPRAAEAFALRYFEGLGNSEIAELLGISQGVVAVLLHRTRARLRKELVALEGAN